MNANVLRRLAPVISKASHRSVAVSQPSTPFRLCRIDASARRPFSGSSSVAVKKYTEDHEWIELDSDGKTGTIGITEYAAKALGDVVYVELPEIGLEVAKGDTIGAVESVKSASDILTPVAGTITHHNSTLEERPGTINKSPESDGWLAKIEVSDSAELDDLMSKEDYDNFEKE